MLHIIFILSCLLAGIVAVGVGSFADMVYRVLFKAHRSNVTKHIWAKAFKKDLAVMSTSSQNAWDLVLTLSYGAFWSLLMFILTRTSLTNSIWLFVFAVIVINLVQTYTLMTLMKIDPPVHKWSLISIIRWVWLISVYSVVLVFAFLFILQLIISFFQ